MRIRRRRRRETTDFLGETNGIVSEVGIAKESDILGRQERGRKWEKIEVKEEKEMDPEE